MGTVSFRKLSILCFASSIVSAPSARAAALDGARASSLFARDSTVCGGITGLVQCGYGLPSGWCCAAGTNCLALNNTGTVASICCPTGSDCTTIQPISCDISQQNATLFPESSIHAANLTQELSKCGTGCCPLGYSCTPSGFCQMLPQTKAVSPSSTTGSSSTVAPTSKSDTTQVLSKPAKTFSGSSFAAGFIPGIILGLFLAAAVMYFIHQRKKASRDSIFGSMKPDRQISDPIYHPQLAARTDFLNHNRTGSADSFQKEPPIVNASLTGGYYDPNRPDTATTLTAGRSPDGHERKDLEVSQSKTPTKGRGIFTRSSSIKRKDGPVNFSRNARKSTASTATIDVLMGNALPAPLPIGGGPGYGQNAKGNSTFHAAESANPYGWGLAPPPDLRRKHDTTFSDVMRAVGATESQAATPQLSPSPARKQDKPKLTLGSPYRGHDRENMF